MLFQQRARAQSGFTLLEILVALGILSILMSISSSFFIYNLRNNMNMQIRYEAIQAAQSVLDELRFEDVSTLTGPKHEDVSIDHRTYAVTVVYCQMSTFCTSTDVKHIAVDVKYKNKLIYETDTVYSKL